MMKTKNILINLLMLSAGIAIGGIGAKSFFKKKYEDQYQQDLESIRKDFLSKEEPTIKKAPDPKEPNKEILSAEKIIGEQGYAQKVNYRQYFSSQDQERADDEQKSSRPVEPFRIPPVEFGELDGYENITLTYYQGDGTLTDDDYRVMNDYDDIIGEDALDYFGEYEEDAVYVRNEQLKCDYEILRDYRSYEEILEEKPYLREKGDYD